MIFDIFKQNAGAPAKSEETRFDRYAAYIIIAGAFLLPLFFIPLSAFSLPFAKALLLAVIGIAALLFWLIGRLQDGIIRIPKSTILVALLVLIAVSLASAIFSPSAQASFFGLSYELGTFGSVLFLTLIAFLGALLFESRSRLFSLYIAVVASFLVVFVFQTANIFSDGDFLFFKNFDASVGSILGKWNDLALFAGMTALLSLVTIEYLTLEKKARIFFYCVLALALATLFVASFSLAWGILGVFALIISVYRFSLILFAKKAGKALAANTLPFVSLAVLLLSVLFFLSGDALQGPLSNALGINQLEVRPAWSATTDIIKGTWKENLLLGSGPNLFVKQWLLLKDEAVNSSIFWNTDFRFGIGLVPTFAVTTGILGALAWLFFLGALVYRGARAFLSASDEVTHYFVFSLFAVLVYLWSAMIFYVPSMPLAAYAFLFSGCFIALMAQKKFIKTISFTYTADPRIGFATVLVLVTLLIGIVVGGYFVAKRVIAFLYFQNARTAFESAGDIARAEQSLGKAIGFFPADAFYRSLIDVRLAQISDLLQNKDVSTEAARARFQELLGFAVASGNAAIAANSTDYMNWLALARVYASLVPLKVEGAYESAKPIMENARARNPKSPRLVLEAARLEIAHGAKDEGKKLVDEALRLKSNYTDAVFVLAQIEIDAGNVKNAITSLEKAAFLSPNDAGIFFQLGLLKYNQKEYAGAREALSRAVQLVPDYANARYFLGLAQYELKNVSAAIGEFEAIQKTNPDNAEVARIIANVKSGRAPLEKTATAVLDEPPIEE